MPAMPAARLDVLAVLPAVLRRAARSRPTPAGLIRWPVKLLLPLGFALLALQGLSELIKRIAALRGADSRAGRSAHEYERPMQ